MAFKPKDRIAWTIAFPGSTEFEVRFGVVESLSTKGRINVKFDDGRRARIDGTECAKQKDAATDPTSDSIPLHRMRKRDYVVIESFSTIWNAHQWSGTLNRRI